MSAAFAGAIDLSALKNQPQPAPGSGAGAQPSADGAPASRFVLDVTEATFSQVVQASTEVLVVIDLWATWCEPCKQLSPILEKLAAAGNGAWILAKVDVDANPRISQAFGVQSIPTVVALAGGQPVDAFSGALPEPQVRQWIEGLLTELRDKLPGIKAAQDAAGPAEEEPADPRFVVAEQAIESGDYAAAAREYRAILDAEPGNAEAEDALAQAEFLARVALIPPGAVIRADAKCHDVSLRCQAADVQVAAGDVTGGFDRLIGAIREADGDDRATLREHLIALFALFPATDGAVLAGRRALAAALY